MHLPLIMHDALRCGLAALQSAAKGRQVHDLTLVETLRILTTSMDVEGKTLRFNWVGNAHDVSEEFSASRNFYFGMEEAFSQYS